MRQSDFEALMKFVLVVVAIAVIVIASPLLIAGWGARTIYRNRARGTPEQTAWVVGGSIAVVSAVVLAFVMWPAVLNADKPAAGAESNLEPTSQPPLWPDPSPTLREPDGPAVVPRIVGRTLKDAVASLKAVALGPQTHDATPLDRSPSPRDWVVVDVRPVAGTILPPGATVDVWAMPTAEHRWFKRHPHMPAIDVGAESMLLDAGVLGPVSDLILFRYAPGEGPPFADLPTRIDEPRGGVAPWQERRNERRARKGLRVSYGVDQVAGQWPLPGESLRMGQLLLITERDAIYGGSGQGSSPGVDGDIDYYYDDDDYNVPGYLCPTRFC